MVVKRTMFHHLSIHIYLDLFWWEDSQIDHVLIDRRRLSSIVHVRSGELTVILTTILSLQMLVKY
jgi:hypothetical protein